MKVFLGIIISEVLLTKIDDFLVTEAKKKEGK